jgi:hypothetical protein
VYQCGLKLVRIHFGEQDKFQGGEIVTDAAEIMQTQLLAGRGPALRYPTGRF